MAEKKPIVVGTDGRLEELQPGDTLPGSAVATLPIVTYALNKYGRPLMVYDATSGSHIVIPHLVVTDSDGNVVHTTEDGGL